MASWVDVRSINRFLWGLDELRTRAALTGGYNYEMPMIAKITQQLADMVNYMKHENRAYLKSQKAAMNERDQSPPPTTTTATPESPTKAIRSTFESVVKSLVAVLAHTAACAHATAAINAYSQAYYAYLQVGTVFGGFKNDHVDLMGV